MIREGLKKMEFSIEGGGGGCQGPIHFFLHKFSTILDAKTQKFTGSVRNLTFMGLLKGLKASI